MTSGRGRSPSGASAIDDCCGMLAVHSWPAAALEAPQGRLERGTSLFIRVMMARLVDSSTTHDRRAGTIVTRSGRSSPAGLHRLVCGVIRRTIFGLGRKSHGLPTPYRFAD